MLSARDQRMIRFRLVDYGTPTLLHFPEERDEQAGHRRYDKGHHCDCSENVRERIPCRNQY